MLPCVILVTPTLRGVSTPPQPLRPDDDIVDLTQAICDIPSPSGSEAELADLVEAALRERAHLQVRRDGDAVMARTAAGPAHRVVVAGHLDTVPVGSYQGRPNLPTWRAPASTADTGSNGGPDAPHEALWGRGTVDMKGGVAMALSVAAAVDTPIHQVTWVFYDHEEVEAERNGLGRLVRHHPDWFDADFAVLAEPSGGTVEGGCNGTIRVEVSARGVAAHAARAWTGRNAIHAAGAILSRLAEHTAGAVEVDGLVYRESLGAVGIRGGIATNVVPDICVVTVNYRFAPSRTAQQAELFLRDFFDGFDVTVTDIAAGARPGLRHPAAAAFVAAIGAVPRPKHGWTDVARFAEMGIPAVNFGPGDPLLAHRDDEHCPVDSLRTARACLYRWLTGTT